MDGAPDVPVGHLIGSQRINAGEGVDVVLDAVTFYGAAVVICHGELTAAHSGRCIHTAVQNCGVQIGGNHHTDADVSVIFAGVLDIGHLVIGTAGDKLYVLAVILCRICFDLRIGVEGIASFVLAGVAGAFLGYIRPQLGFGSCAVGDTSVFTVQAGLQQVNLDVAYGEGVRCALGVGEVGQRCAHNGDGYKSNTQEDCGNFLFHDVPYSSIKIWDWRCACAHRGIQGLAAAAETCVHASAAVSMPSL